MMTLLLSPIATLTMSFIAILILKKIAPQIGLLDIPGGRKTHASPTPVIGGIAIFLGLCAGIFLLPLPVANYSAFLLGALLIVIMGALDDRHEIEPKIRLLIECIALFIMIIMGNVVLRSLGNLWGTGPVLLHWLQIPITLFGAATLINAINMIDGMDGLSGSLSLIAFTCLSVLAFFKGHTDAAMILGLLSMTLIVFLVFNFPWTASKKASIFMGDAGSTLIGFAFAWFTIDLSQQATAPIRPVMMLWLLALPLWDLATVFLLRLRAGRSPFHATPDHVYNRLKMLGLSHRATLGACIMISLISLTLGLAFEALAVNEYVSFSTFITLFLIYLFCSNWIKNKV